MFISVKNIKSPPKRLVRSPNAINQIGMTLIELMVVVGLMGIVALGVMSLLENMMKGNKTASLRNEENQLQIVLARQLAEPTACTNTFSAGGAPTFAQQILNAAPPGGSGSVTFLLTGANPFQILNPDTTVFTPPLNGHAITGYQMSQISDLVVTDPGPPVKTKLNGNLVINLTRTATGTFVGSATQSLSINIDLNAYRVDTPEISSANGNGFFCKDIPSKV